MLFDWFTLSAQVLNFLILVWLLKHFLYKPILKALDTREKQIAKKIKEADSANSEAEKEREKFRDKNDKFDQEREELMHGVREEVNNERRRLLDEALQAADVLRVKQQEEIKREQQNLSQSIIQKTQAEVFAITRKTLADLSDTSLEERMLKVFNLRLRNMDAVLKESVASSLKASNDPVLVRSAFDIPSGHKNDIQQSLNEIFSDEILVRYETAPELISGIELSANGQKVAWSISDYLVSMEKSVAELLKEQDEKT
jgi:F-type H+-transporting ATPase subunit b